jgi:NAD+ synthase (glutamine-hydrolysing)
MTRTSVVERSAAGRSGLVGAVITGTPLRYRHRIYNCAIVIHRGRVLGVAPKSYLPTYGELYERRQIAPGDDVRTTLVVGGQTVPFGPDLLFRRRGCAGLRAARRGLRGHVGAGPTER